MIARLLGQHPALCALHEPRPRLNVEAYASWSKLHPPKRIRQQVWDKRHQLLSEIKSNNFLYIESAHWASHLIEELHELFDARFIHLHRDGRQFVRSGLERRWYENFSTASSQRIFLIERLVRYPRRKFMVNVGNSYIDHRLKPPRKMRSRFEKITWLWQEINQTIIDSLNKLPDTAKMRLRLEDVNKETIIGLQNFIGVPLESKRIKRMLAIAQQKPNKTRQRTVSAPEDWPEGQKERFREIAGKMMQDLGYSLD